MRALEDRTRGGVEIDGGGNGVIRNRRWLNITWTYSEPPPGGRLSGFEIVVINGTNPDDTDNYLIRPVIARASDRQLVRSISVDTSITNARCAVRALYGEFKSPWYLQGVGQIVASDPLVVASNQAVIDAQADAAAALAELGDIGADGKLHKNEKIKVIREYNDLLNEQVGIDAQATLFSITTEKTNYDSALAALTSYLNGLSPAWNSTSTTTTISRTIWNTNWQDVYAKRQTLLNKIAEEAAKRSTWANVSNRPSDAQLLNNLIDPSVWVVDSTGTQGPFAANGSAVENRIVMGAGPFGTIEPLWEGGTDAANDGDGGWDCNFTNGYDHTKSYRLLVWAKQTNTAGTVYLGCHSSSTQNLGTLTDNTNPYFFTGDLPQNNKWYLIVGILHGSGYTGADTGIAGVYDPATGQKVLDANEFRNKPGSTIQRHRVYLYYSTDVLNFAWFTRPRVDLIDGNEPSLSEVMDVGRTAYNAAAAAQADATSSLTQLSDIASDSKLTAAEKISAKREYEEITQEQSGIDAQASAFSITTEKTNYDSAITSLKNYLKDTVAVLNASYVWTSITGTTNIVRADWDANWKSVYNTRQILLNKIAAIAGTRADWTTVTGAPSGTGVNVIPPKYRRSLLAALPPISTGAGTLSRETANTFFGTKGAFKSAATSTNNYLMLSPSTTTYNIAITPNKKWLLSAYVYPSISGNIQLGIRTSAAGAYIGLANIPVTGSAWQRVAIVLDASADNSPRCIVRLDNELGVGNYVIWDGVMLEEYLGSGTTPSAFHEVNVSVDDDDFPEIYDRRVNAGIDINGDLVRDIPGTRRIGGRLGSAIFDGIDDAGDLRRDILGGRRVGGVLASGVAAGFNDSGDVIRPISTTVANASNIYRRTGGGIFTGDDNATYGANWSTTLTARPSELTDGRIAAGFNSSGDILRPVSEAVRQASLLMGRLAAEGLRSATQQVNGIFSESFDDPNSASDWQNYSGSGEVSRVAISDSKTGGYCLRIGNNSGNDQAWLIHKRLIPFDQARLYRFRVRVRRTSGSGTVYLGFAGVAADGTTLVNTTGANTSSGQHYIAGSGLNPGTSWTEYVGYLKGTALSGVASYPNSASTPAAAYDTVRYIRPLILANFNNVAGQVDVDYFEVEDAVNQAGILSVGSEGFAVAAGIGSSNNYEFRAIGAGEGIECALNTAGDTIVVKAKGTEIDHIVLHSDRVVSSTTLANVTDFAFAVEANSTYKIELVGYYQSAATTTGLKIGATAPTSSKMIAQFTADNTAASSTEATFMAAGTTSVSATFTNTGVAASDRPVTMQLLLITGATAGVFQLQLASEVASSNITLKLGSCMTLQRLTKLTPALTVTLQSPGLSASYSDSELDADEISLSCKTDGTWSISSSGGLASGSGNWGTPTTSGVGPGYEVRFTAGAISGSGSVSNAASSWTALTSNRVFSLSCGSTTNIKSASVTVTMEVRKIGTTTPLSSGSATFSVYSEPVGGEPCVCIDSFMPLTSKRAGEMSVGDPLLVLTNTHQSFLAYGIKSHAIKPADCVRLIAANGSTLIVSWNTPVTQPNGSVIIARQAAELRAKVAHLTNGEFGWTELVGVEELGERLVAQISCDNKTYAAGEHAGKFLFTHNAKN